MDTIKRSSVKHPIVLDTWLHPWYVKNVLNDGVIVTNGLRTIFVCRVDFYDYEYLTMGKELISHPDTNGYNKVIFSLPGICERMMKEGRHPKLPWYRKHKFRDMPIGSTVMVSMSEVPYKYVGMFDKYILLGTDNQQLLLQRRHDLGLHCIPLIQDGVYVPYNEYMKDKDHLKSISNVVNTIRDFPDGRAIPESNPIPVVTDWKEEA